MSFHFCWKYWCTKAGVLKYWSAEVLVYWSSHRWCFVKEDIHNNFAKFTGKHLCRSLCFKKSLEVCNVIKKETLAQVFSCEFCEISKNTFFTEHLRATASECWHHMKTSQMICTENQLTAFHTFLVIVTLVWNGSFEHFLLARVVELWSFLLHLKTCTLCNLLFVEDLFVTLSFVLVNKSLLVKHLVGFKNIFN